MNLLRYVAKYRRSSDLAAYEELRRCWLEVQDGQAALERLDGEEQYEGQRQKLRTILQRQARHIATFVRGERAAYRAWVGRW